MFHACIFLRQRGRRRLFLGWIGVIPIACPLLSIPLLGKVDHFHTFVVFRASLLTTGPECSLFWSLAVGSRFFPLSWALLFCCRFKHKWPILLHSLHFWVDAEELWQSQHPPLGPTTRTSPCIAISVMLSWYAGLHRHVLNFSVEGAPGEVTSVNFWAPALRWCCQVYCGWGEFLSVLPPGRHIGLFLHWFVSYCRCWWIQGRTLISTGLLDGSPVVERILCPFCPLPQHLHTPSSLSGKPPRTQPGHFLVGVRAGCAAMATRITFGTYIVIFIPQQELWQFVIQRHADYQVTCQVALFVDVCSFGVVCESWLVAELDEGCGSGGSIEFYLDFLWYNPRW